MEQHVKTLVDYIANNSERWLESPRKSFFGGRSKRALKFRTSFRPSKNKIIFEFESGTKLGIELWRVEETLQFLKEKNCVVEIGARNSENYSNDSLEGHLKNIAKIKYERSTDTKTAPHIVDLLVLTNIAELAYTTSPKNRNVQGVKFIR